MFLFHSKDVIKRFLPNLTGKKNQICTESESGRFRFPWRNINEIPTYYLPTSSESRLPIVSASQKKKKNDS